MSFSDYDVYPERPDGYSEFTEEVVLAEFCKYVKKEFGTIVSSQMRWDIREIIFRILTAPKGKITVIPAQMGFGKSTLLEVLIKCMRTLYPNSFACIVAKERLGDAKKTANSINQLDIYEENEACAWKGFNEKDCMMGFKEYRPLTCKKCPNKACDIKQSLWKKDQTPVVSLTHSRLASMASNWDYQKSIKYWLNGDDQIERKFLFIDEKPAFFTTGKIDNYVLNQFQSALMDIIQKAGDNHDAVTFDTKLIFKQIEEFMETIPTGEYLPCHNLQMLEQLGLVKYFWGNYYNGTHSEYLSWFEDLFTNGGFRSDKKVTVYRVTDYHFEDYATVIFDGTAIGDLIYPSDCIFADLSHQRTFQQLTINHCKKNLSKSHLEITSSVKGDKLKVVKEKIGQLIPDILQIAESGRTLVVCFKDHEDIIIELLEGKCDTISIDHFNNLKGKNAFLDCVNLFFLGTMNFGDGYYFLKAFVINPEEISSSKVYNDNINKQRLYECDFINEVKRNDQENYILQDMFRVAIRNINNNTAVNIYIFTRDEKLVNNIAERLPGCTLKQWVPEQYKNNHIAPTEGRVLECLEKLLPHKGCTISKRQLEQEAIITSEHRKKLFQRESIQQWLCDKGIRINKFDIIRE